MVRLFGGTGDGFLQNECGKTAIFIDFFEELRFSGRQIN